MSRSRYVRWSDSAILYDLKAHADGIPTKQIAQNVARGEPAVLDLLQRYAEIGRPKLCPHCGKPVEAL